LQGESVAEAGSEANLEALQAVIDHALAWERHSGATVESGKTAIIHFSRTARRVDQDPSTIKGKTFRPKATANVLGVVPDRELGYKQHITEAAAKGLSAAMQLKRLRGLSPRVAPAMVYASNRKLMHPRGL
jgi:hypothetical protein